jgi:hypothetical protein
MLRSSDSNKELTKLKQKKAYKKIQVDKDFFTYQ